MQVDTPRLQDNEVAELIRFIRNEEDKEHIAQLCADVSSEFARMARYVAKVGLSLSAEWASADHMILDVKELSFPLFTVHVRTTGEHDHQAVSVSHAVSKKHDESAPVSFLLPDQFTESKNHILLQVFNSFPKNRLLVKDDEGKIVPLFAPAPPPEPVPARDTWDEGAIKNKAMELAGVVDGVGRIIMSPFAPDNQRIRSFAR